MNTPRKFTTSLIAVVGSACLVACASGSDVATVPEAHSPLIVDNYGLPDAGTLYANRYPSSIVQVAAGNQRRFVDCQDHCPGATPKTPIKDLNATVARRAQAAIRATRAGSTTALQPLRVRASKTDVGLPSADETVVAARSPTEDAASAAPVQKNHESPADDGEH